MLTLPIKKKWFDMIVSGEKKEEYREIKQYYQSRFNKYIQSGTKIRFRNGYGNDSPSCICDVSISFGEGESKWGASEGKMYYVLSLHEVSVEARGLV